MRTIQRDSRVALLTNQMGLVESLTNMLDQLNRSQKALNQYLEVKRSLFPRFYFLGDEDLLEILGQATRPQIIQSHLKKLFSGRLCRSCNRHMARFCNQFSTNHV